MFVGREKELRQLERAYRSKESAFLPVYGRRRVGKTELLLEFTRDKPAVLFFLGQKAPPPVQIRQFLQQAAHAVGEPLLAELDVSTWREALLKVMDRIPRGKKFILVFDEFQWIAQASGELPSVLQELWDLHWSRGGNVMLLLCGSFVGFMEKEVLGRESPLFGRKTGQVFLKPFSYREAALFHTRISIAERAKTCFVCGGIPYYLKLFDAGESFASNIQRHLLDPGGALSNEPDFLMREELREVEKFYAILMAIASGAGTGAEIEKLSGIPARNHHYYTAKLDALGYTSRRFPLTARRPAPKQVRHVLEDPLLRFWFRFLYPNQTGLARYSPAKNYHELLEPELDSYFGDCFERLCREALPDIYLAEGIEVRTEIGEFWNAETQIDVVSRRRDDSVDLGECKWGRVRSWPGLERELRTRMARYPNPKNQTIRGRIFSRSEPPAKFKQGNDVRITTLREMYDS